LPCSKKNGIFKGKGGVTVIRPDDSRSKKVMVLASTITVTLVLALIVLFAALSPASPERVVSEMLKNIAEQDSAGLENFVAGSAEESLLNADSQDNSRWRFYWGNGKELFTDFRVAEVQVSGNQAVVLVLYGPGLFHEEEFILYRHNRRWKVYDIND